MKTLSKEIWIGIFQLKNWKAYELIWLGTFSAIAIALSFIWQDNLFGLTVTITGILCVLLAAKGQILTYVFGTYNVIGYAILSWSNGLFGEVGLNILFFLPMNIIGFIVWSKNTSNGIVKMRGLKVKQMLWIAVANIAIFAVLGWGLSFIPSQNTPYIDSITTVLSITATLLMTWRFKEQWMVWIVLNVFTIIMWSYRLANGSPDGLMMIVMWSAYLANSVYGYITWTKGVKENASKKG